MRRFKPVAVFACGLLLASYVGLGTYYRSYRPETSDNYIWGAYHVHSTLSDGLLPIEKIAGEAREARVGFVVLTDHGLPHPTTSTLDATLDGVRFIGGSEAGLPEGHIIFFGAQEAPLSKLPPSPPEALEDIREWGGFAVLTYPDDPRDQWEYWEPDLAPDGIEVINITSYFRGASPWRKLATVAFAPFSDFHFLTTITAPEKALVRWDELLTRREVLGFYACNAHGGFELAPGLALPVPSYLAAFSLAGLGVDRRYEASPENALRAGDFFSVLRGAGEPQLFDYHARRDGSIHPSGSSIAGPADLTVRVETENLQPRIVLKRDGAIVAASPGKQIRHAADSPGVYRAEVYLEGHPLLSSDVPWIVSNPIFVDRQASPLPQTPFPCGGRQRLPLEELRVEKDEESTAGLERREAGGLFTYRLSRATPERIDRWVALALRKKMDLSPFEGFYIEALSEHRMRYWIEIRSGERSFYASFKLYPDRANRLVVPFSKFYAMFGKREPRMPLGAIDSLFITVNTSNSVTGFSSELTIREAGFCRR